MVLKSYPSYVIRLWPGVNVPTCLALKRVSFEFKLYFTFVYSYCVSTEKLFNFEQL